MFNSLNKTLAQLEQEEALQENFQNILDDEEDMFFESMSESFGDIFLEADYDGDGEDDFDEDLTAEADAEDGVDEDENEEEEDGNFEDDSLFLDEDDDSVSLDESTVAETIQESFDYLDEIEDLLLGESAEGEVNVEDVDVDGLEEIIGESLDFDLDGLEEISESQEIDEDLDLLDLVD